MNFSFSESIKSVFLYGFSSIISRGIPFLLLPLLTSNLSEEEFGIIAIMSALMLIINSPVYMGLNTLIDVNFFKVNRKTFRNLLFSVLYIPFLITFFLSIVFANFTIISNFLNINPEYLVYIPVLVLLNNFYLIPAQLFRLNNQPLHYFALEVFYSITHFLLTYLFIESMMMGVPGRIYAWLLTGFILTLISFFLLNNYQCLTFIFNKKNIIYFFCYSIKLMPHQLGSLSLRILDRIFVNIFLGISAAGSYAVGYQIASISLVFISVINMVWVPFLFQKLVKPSDVDKLLIVKLTYSLIACIFAFNVCLFMLSEYIYMYFIDSKFSNAIIISNLLLIGFFITGIYTLFTDYLFFTSKNHILSYVTLFNLVFTSILYYILIPIYGLVGSAYSSIFSMVFTCLLTIYFSNKSYPMPWLFWFRLKYYR